MGVQERLPTVILTISLNADVPRSVPLMVTVVPPSVGPLSGESLVITGDRSQPQGAVMRLVEHVAEAGTQVLPHHPQIPSVLDVQS